MSKSTTTNRGMNPKWADNSLPEMPAKNNGLPEPRPVKVTDPRDREMEELS